ncbi:S41 family peptidase [Gemmatimonas sp.]|jgi:C-terminal processing protease CtpA/Prc|uniref:S41 family peptidase n=1 Tax=Gemmatimonas sp. TaxID=1962908 RepID=UPI0025BC5C2B|nr:S41 family peptidase [Gemmatimonas sp.]MCA2984971.1 peptidase S41 [Gemmatimonas sp.]MCA2985986.1 peptidase S41 [Gemmatimonas sp.]MCA2995302.1 peptidase S41 [Gemmatimonas sp.]
MIPAVDREFDQGSRLEARELSPTQVANLALLGRVWGFAKYHHPVVVTSARNWDYELFRIAPLVLAAPDRSSAAAAMVTWLDALGAIPACRSCVTSPSGVQLAADNAWIEDAATLGPALSDRLKSMHRNRPSSQRYVSFVPNVGNPDFSIEERYATLASPDAGYRLLALFRFWNIIAYWFPYRDVMDEDWNAVLSEFIPVMMRPLTGDAYRLALIRLIGRIHDTHANIWSDLRVQPPTGSAEAPLILRFVENRLLVTGYTHPTLGPATGLRIGDEIQSIGGVPVTTLVDSLRPYYPASNEPTRLRDMARSLTRGAGPVALAGVGAAGAFSVSVNRQPLSTLDRSRALIRDLEGPTFRMLADSVAYLKLSSVVAASAASYIEQAQRARVLVIDIRNYPSDFMVFALGGLLVGSPAPFARFTVGDASNPGAFRWGPFASHTPRTPRFTGTVVILVDETTQSMAEYTAMAFRVAPGAIVVGSTTAGADGNVSRFPLPGNVEGMISGIGVFYPDGRPTQRIGIVPDLVVRPTVAGIRAGRDEVLEAGVSRALGRAFRLP